MKTVVNVVVVTLLLAVSCYNDDIDTPDDLGEVYAFKVMITNVSLGPIAVVGEFLTPVGETVSGSIDSNGAYEFEVSAAMGDRLSFVTKFEPSTDLFLAPSPGGIPLFNEEGVPMSGDVTSYVGVWDLGTEANLPLGDSASLADDGAGAEPESAVMMASNGDLPPVTDIVRVTLEPVTAAPGVAGTIKVKIENISTDETLTIHELDAEGGLVPTDKKQSVPLSPGVWVTHRYDSPLWSEGAPDRGQGLREVAEEGDPSVLANTLSADPKILHKISPGYWVVHSGPNPLFEEGKSLKDNGLEALAEDGNPSHLAAEASPETYSGLFGAGGPPIGPGETFEFTFKAVKGEKLSFATMYVESNDLFFAPNGEGIELFLEEKPTPAIDITSHVFFWDAGSEVNEKPGEGENQAPSQAQPNTGESEGNVVRKIDNVSDGFVYPSRDSVLNVRLAPL